MQITVNDRDVGEETKQKVELTEDKMNQYFYPPFYPCLGLSIAKCL